MDLNLKNKNAFVSGSSQGIGSASAVELSILGANVTIATRIKSCLKSIRIFLIILLKN
jgi:3-oxoacyl-[acyl-carrier protein] reductase